jgi:hypothetical protein
VSRDAIGETLIVDAENYRFVRVAQALHERMFSR